MDLEIETPLLKVLVSLKHLSMYANVRFTFNSLQQLDAVNDVTVPFKQFQFCFTQRPKIIYDIVLGNLISLSQIPTIEAWLSRIAQSVVKEKLLFPKQLSYSFLKEKIQQDTENSNSTAYEYSKSKLNIKIMSCQFADIDVKSIDILGGLPDPFVIVKLLDQTQKTGIKYNTVEPKWNENFIFFLNEKDIINNQSIDINFEIKDYDYITSDDTVAEIKFGLMNVIVQSLAHRLTRDYRKIGSQQKTEKNDDWVTQTVNFGSKNSSTITFATQIDSPRESMLSMMSQYFLKAAKVSKSQSHITEISSRFKIASSIHINKQNYFSQISKD